MTSEVATLFAVSFGLAVLILAAGWTILDARRRRRGLERLENKPEAPPVEVVILREENPDAGNRLMRALSEHIEWQIRRAGEDGEARRVLAKQGAFLAAGFVAGTQITFGLPPIVAGLLGGAAGAAVPYWNLRRKARKRMHEFEEQFPEALDFLSRSMRAGHAFAISLGLLAEDAAEPLGAEFRKVAHEHALGAPLGQALEALSSRMPSLDVRFFVSAVLLQAETGGNLSEILTKLSGIIRERFRLRGQVKAASAHGRITGTILMIMPVALGGGLSLVSPEYLKGMWEDAHGRVIVIAAVVAQALGCLTIRKIIRIKV
jgi:tight adherence protein B